MVPRQRNTFPSSYIAVSAGKGTEQKDRTTYIKESLNPQFDKCYELQIVFPKNMDLFISLYEWDPSGQDDELIGSTKIELENRILNDEWNSMESSPIEQRSLWHPTCSSPQGEISLWLDILTAEEAETYPPVYIGPRITQRCEMRLALRDAKGLPACDSVLIEAYMEGYSKQATDIRWNNRGTSKLNCLMKYYLELPCKHSLIKLQMKTESDIEVASGYIDLAGLFSQHCKEKKKIRSVPKQHVPLGNDGVYVEVEIELLDEDEALHQHKLSLSHTGHPFLSPREAPPAPSRSPPTQPQDHVSLIEIHHHHSSEFGSEQLDEISFISDQQFPKQTFIGMHKKKVVVGAICVGVIIFTGIICHVLFILHLLPEFVYN